MLYPNLNDIPGRPPRFKDTTFADIIMSVPPGGALQVLTPLEYHTKRQRNWYKGIAVRELSGLTGYTELGWDGYWKKNCHGKELLKIEHKGTKFERLTTKGVGKRNMTQFIIEICDLARDKNIPLTSPDPKLRKK